MTVSVVMIVLDGARFLGGAIQSVLAQTRPADEIVVVDGGSRDGSPSIAVENGLTVLRQPGTGIADARNHGVASTVGELVAFLDCDDRWLPTKLEQQEAALERSASAGYCVTMLAPRRAGRGIATHQSHARRLELGTIRGLTPSALVVRRRVLDEVGGFDADLGIGCDSDWFARATDLGIGRVDLDDVLVEKLLHDRNASIDVAESRRAMLRILRGSVARKAERS